MNDRSAAATAWSTTIPPSVRAALRVAIRVVRSAQPEERTAAVDELAAAVDRIPPSLREWILESEDLP